MKATKSLWGLIFLFMPAVVAGGQSSSGPGDLHSEIQRVYNFQPHALSKEQISEKSAVLDQFWEKAKLQRETYVPGLRRELADFSNPPFFLFDGSQLLRSLSEEAADRKIVLAAIAHSDLRDLQLKDYFLLVHSMAAKGEDTTAAAFHILEEPKFQVFIAEHYLTLAQNYCLVYMLLPTDQEFWIRPAIERLRAEKDVTAQQSLLLLLWYAQTTDADKALVEFSGDAGRPQALRDYANELIGRKESVDQKLRGASAGESEESLRQARQERMKAVSDEALYDLDDYTLKIILKRK